MLTDVAELIDGDADAFPNDAAAAIRRAMVRAGAWLKVDEALKNNAAGSLSGADVCGVGFSLQEELAAQQASVCWCERIDWSLLREQKEWLVEQLTATEAPARDHAEGLVNLLDAIQDEAVGRLHVEAVEVFG